MKSILKLVPVLIMLVLSAQFAIAQRSQNWCATGDIHLELMKNNPEYRKSYEQNESVLRTLMNNNPPTQKSNGLPIYTIPVVFHVIHNYGPENISKAAILTEMEYLNKSFQNQWADTVDINPVFKPLLADCQIEFKLAQIDPSGNCTDGITRTVSPYSFNGTEFIHNVIKWPTNQYVNIWVVAAITNNVGAAAYAYYPANNNPKDGIVTQYSFVGSQGSNYDQRVLSHEFGHYLNLPHTWGSGTVGAAANCSGDDFVMDTPNTIGVANFSCNYNQVTCGTLDNVENYMDYASCSYMFTNGQKARMHAALNNPTGGRNNLHTNANLIATGTDPGFVPTACLLIPDFNKAIKYVCAGETVTFSDQSYNGDPTSWQWDFPGGTPSTSTDQNPVVQYNTPGVYDVTLTISNSGGTVSVSGSQMVLVSLTNGANAIPFLQDFENTGPIPSNPDWVIVNPEGNNAWELSTVAAFSGSKSMMLNNYIGNSNSTSDDFITPGYDFSNITGASMTFRVAFAARSSTSTDQLKVYASTTCGEFWALRFTKTGLNLSTAGIITSNFVPNNTQWRQETVNLSSVSYSNKPNVRFKFNYLQSNGNNIYIDDINITGTSTIGIEDVQFLATLNVYPNPSSGGTNVSFSLSEAADIKIEIMDITGRVLQLLENRNLATGNYNYSFGDEFSAGIYFIRIQANANDITKKVILTR